MTVLLSSLINCVFQKFAKQSRIAFHVSGGPPPFVPFGKRIASQKLLPHSGISTCLHCCANQLAQAFYFHSVFVNLLHLHVDAFCKEACTDERRCHVIYSGASYCVDNVVLG